MYLTLVRKTSPSPPPPALRRLLAVLLCALLLRAVLTALADGLPKRPNTPRTLGEKDNMATLGGRAGLPV